MGLYSAALSPNSLRARAVAFELGLDIELIEVNLRNGGNKTAEYLALNPNGKVPVLVDGDFVLWESRAINGCLASLKPERGLYPTDAKGRAVVDQWTYWHTIHLGPAMQQVAFERFSKAKFGMGAPDESAIAQQLQDIARFLPVLDGQLAGKDWVTGSLSLADFAIASAFMARVPANIALDHAPNVAAWIKRLEPRPSWKKAVAPMLAGLGI